MGLVILYGIGQRVFGNERFVRFSHALEKAVRRNGFIGCGSIKTEKATGNGSLFCFDTW